MNKCKSAPTWEIVNTEAQLETRHLERGTLHFIKGQSRII